MQYLREVTGLSEAQIATLWNSNGFMRDAGCQQIMYDAARYHRIARKSPPTPVKKPVPPVQRPGSAEARSSCAEASVAQLEKQFGDELSVREAASLVAGRRQLRQKRSKSFRRKHHAETKTETAADSERGHHHPSPATEAANRTD